MDEVVTKLTNTVKDINTGKTPVKMTDVRPPAFKAPTKGTSANNNWDMMSMVKIFLIVVILALLGFNIFSYLAKGTDVFSNFLAQYGKYIPEGIKKTLNLTEKGAVLGLDVAAGTVKDVKTIVEKETGVHTKTWKARDKNLNKSLDAGNFTGINNFPQHEPDETESKVQERKKRGWCYIGTDRTFRSCISVNESDKCMSGKIFPTKDICINPSLRQ